MEIVAKNVASQTVKVAASESSKQEVASVKPESVEIKAPPKVAEVETADIEQAIKDLEAFVKGLDRDLAFRRDESIDRSVITVFDASTSKVVRQIPSEEVVAIARQIRDGLDELRAGMLLRGKA